MVGEAGEDGVAVGGQVGGGSEGNGRRRMIAVRVKRQTETPAPV